MTEDRRPSLFISSRDSYNKWGEVVHPVTSPTNVKPLEHGWRIHRGVGDPALILSPDGSFDSVGAITPKLSGGVIETEGQYGKAWQLAEATTNFIVNPRVALNTSGVDDYQSTSTRVTDRPEIGPAAIKTVTHGLHPSNNGPRWRGLSNMNKTGVTELSGSIDVYGTPNDRLYFGVEVVYVDGPAYFNKMFYLPPTGFMRVDQTVAVDPLRTVSRYTVFVGGGRAEPMTFWTGNAQVEEKAHSTPYCDGSLGSGHAWAGTPHNSTSTREAASLSLVEGTTNLSTNPRPDTAWWTTTNQTRTLVDDPRSPSGRATEVTLGQTGYFIGGTIIVPITEHGTYSNSVYIWSDEPENFIRAEGQMFIRYSDGSSGAMVAGVGRGPLTTTPRRLTWTGTTDPAKTPTAVEIYHYVESSVIGAKYRVGAQQVEKKPYNTPYADGSLGEGHSWTGTPNASTSTRIATSNFNTAPQTVVVRYRDNNETTWQETDRNGAGPIGAFGQIIHEGGELTVLPVSQSIEVESFAIYDETVSASEIARVKSIPATWEMGGDGYLTAPYLGSFVSALIRADLGGVETTYYLTPQDGEVLFADAGIIRLDNQEVRVDTDNWVDFNSLSIFEHDLTPEEIARYSETPTSFLTGAETSSSFLPTLPTFDRIRLREQVTNVEMEWDYTPVPKLSHYEIEVSGVGGAHRFLVDSEWEVSTYGKSTYGETVYLGTPLLESRVYLIPNLSLVDQVRIRAVTSDGRTSPWSGNERVVPSVVVSPLINKSREHPHKVTLILSPNISTEVIRGRVEWRVGQ